MKVVKGKKEYFKGIRAIKYEGKDSDNPLAFKYYNPRQRVGKKTMEAEILKEALELTQQKKRFLRDDSSKKEPSP